MKDVSRGSGPTRADQFICAADPPANEVSIRRYGVPVEPIMLRGQAPTSSRLATLLGTFGLDVQQECTMVGHFRFGEDLEPGDRARVGHQKVARVPYGFAVAGGARIGLADEVD
jgi:hypothetical protein